VREKVCLKVYIGEWEGKRKSVGGVRGLCRPEAEVGLGARQTMGVGEGGSGDVGQ
jgi:hypothetical protein